MLADQCKFFIYYFRKQHWIIYKFKISLACACKEIDCKKR